MPKINYPIPLQGYELIRERIAEILIDELGNQVILSYAPYLDADVFIESVNPEDKEHLPVVNISLAHLEWSNQNQGSKDGTYTYHIDCYTNSATTDDNTGDYLANAQLQRILGVIRAILENQLYCTLGFQRPFIQRVYCSEMNFANKAKNDALNSMMGRLSFIVVATETTPGIIPSLIAGYDTEVKIDDTNKGYYYSG